MTKYGELVSRLLPDRMLPLARALGFQRQAVLYRLKAAMSTADAAEGPVVFVIGCGRSGTTLLGSMMGAHPEVTYLFEPYEAWAAISPVTDALQLFAHGEHRCLLDASHVTPKARRRFRALMSPPQGMTLVEKSPFNTWRIGYLTALSPTAKFVHIVRDGVDVARSIEKCAQGELKVAFRAMLNPWWGIGQSKWHSLAADGARANYYPREVTELRTDAQRGAYEWLVSQLEVQKWRELLGPSMVEITYPDLTHDPAGSLRTIAAAVGLSCPSDWLAEVTSWAEPSGSSSSEPLILPEQMCADFNRIQASYGFSGRAIAMNRDLQGAGRAADRS